MLLAVALALCWLAAVRSGDQRRQLGEIVGGHVERGLEADTDGAAQHDLGGSADGPAPAEGFLDALADALAD